MSQGQRDANAIILDEVAAAGSWFHARKTRPIWARRLDQAESIQTLEGIQQAPAGSFLCRGEAGDVWPQTAKRLEAKYTAADEPATDGWQKFVPHPDNLGVMAAQIGHPFTVQATWGELQGKAGDYLVKNFEDRDNAAPNDVWIVGQSLFQATYQPV